MDSTSDVFTDSGPTIVDCSILEAAKENIQPLASGRRVTTLATVLSKPPAQREAALASARRRLEMNVALALEDYDPEDLEGADPLEAYANFVSWTLEHYAEGPSRASNLIPLLEEATRTLKDHADGRWKQDPQYLKLWTLYASFVERPEIIWRFLLANEIGTNLATTYESMATVLERERRTADADEVYLLGIARNAEPINRLKLKHSEFQKRMMAGIMSGPPAETLETAEPVADAAPRRKVLGESKKKTVRPAASEGARPPAPAPAPASQPNARIQVFVDEPSSAGPSSILSLSENADGPSINPFPELGTRVSRVKENTREVSKMGGTKLKQPKSGIPRPSSRPAPAGSSSRSAFAVFVEDSDSHTKGVEMPPPPIPTKGKTAKAVKATKTVTKTSSGVKGKQKASSPAAVPPSEPEESDQELVSPILSKPLFVPFKDEPAKPSILPFVLFKDEEEPPATKAAFVPFRDETSSGTEDTPATVFQDQPATPSKGTLLTATAPDSVMKPKAAHGVDAPLAGNDAEALRKDPLKNYNL